MFKHTTMIVTINVIMLAMFCGLMGCKGSRPHAEHDHGHEAHHGGCLNVIESCELGHAEVKVEGDVLRCWLVEGGQDTDKALRSSDSEIELSIALEDGQTRSLTLQAKPIELAGETVGDCSHFEAQADWLASVDHFEATGKVTVKGEMRDMVVHYPDGYDPDHEGHDHDDHGDHDDHDEEHHEEHDEH